MKKYVQFLVVFILAAGVVTVARNSPAWASPRSSGEARPDSEIIINKDGEYTVGGICNLSVKYKTQNLSDKAAIDVPAETSRKVVFSYPDNLYLSGCHITHFADNKVTSEMSADQGDWEVCFGNRPNEKLTIYYYSDELAAAGQASWLPLETTEKDTFVCAPAMHSGVYAPGGITPNRQENNKNTADTGQTIRIRVGTVMVNSTSDSGRITKPGKYSAGGICELTADYFVPNLSNELHVEENVEISAQVPFPDDQGLLYLPGCHVYHYKNDKVVDKVTTDDGKWEICFAAVPGKQTTIYFYASESDATHVSSTWVPLDTQVNGGTACAELADFTGVYTPVGK